MAARALLALGWYVLSFFPYLVSGRMYWKRRRGELSWWRALLVAHAFVLYNYVAFLATWRAWYRIVSGQHGWAKTRRVREAAASS